MKQSLVLIMAAATLLADCGNPKTAQNTDKTYVKIGENVYVCNADGTYTYNDSSYKFQKQLKDDDFNLVYVVLTNDGTLNSEDISSAMISATMEEQDFVVVGLREADGAADTDNASSSVEYSYDADKDEYTIDNEVYKYKMQLLDEDSAESCNILCNDLSYSFENVQSDESTENYRKI